MKIILKTIFAIEIRPRIIFASIIITNSLYATALNELRRALLFYHRSAIAAILHGLIFTCLRTCFYTYFTFYAINFFQAALRLTLFPADSFSFITAEGIAFLNHFIAAAGNGFLFTYLLFPAMSFYTIPICLPNANHGPGKKI